MDQDHGAAISRGQRRRFRSQQKLDILRAWERSGNGVAVARQHGLPAARLYRWKKQLERA